MRWGQRTLQHSGLRHSFVIGHSEFVIGILANLARDFDRFASDVSRNGKIASPQRRARPGRARRG
jgi:hypothetical protein